MTIFERLGMSSIAVSRSQDTPPPFPHSRHRLFLGSLSRDGASGPPEAQRRPPAGAHESSGDLDQQPPQPLRPPLSLCRSDLSCVAAQQVQREQFDEQQGVVCLERIDAERRDVPGVLAFGDERLDAGAAFVRRHDRIKFHFQLSDEDALDGTSV